MENRAKVAEIISRKEYVNAPLETFLGRMQGKIDTGDGKIVDDPDYMKFYRDGEVTFPCKSHGLWILTQHRRWGFIDRPIDYKKVIAQVHRTDLYREAAKVLGRRAVGFGVAAAVGIPVGFLIGGVPAGYRAVNPLIQILRPISPLAWLPIGLATFKAANPAAYFVIFITAIWPIILNTAFGVQKIPAD